MTHESNALSANKQALLKIRELKQQLAEANSNSNEPIAIVSMACRFPRSAETPEQFWQCLMDRTDEVGDIPEDRWDLEAFFDEDPEIPGMMYARRGVFLKHLDLMDPEFFGISPREATWVDPQQRLLMEVGWEALERAGWPTERIGPETGIFVGWMHNDYQNEASDSFLNLNPYIATGAAGSFLCGRLAYYLGLEGPSVAVDTACSSSLVALHLAIQSLQRRDCNRALVGGVNAICSPTTNILTCKLKALSPTGQSRAFDAAADGYLRGEGCGVVTLRRLSDAERDNDPILGVIRGSAVGHNGFSSGLTAPNPKAQEKVIRQALQDAGIAPEQVAYLEAHGTGTELGDPIEMQAAAAALTPGRKQDDALLVGSVKTNIGHLEAAAGMAGLIKVLLSLQNQQIPGQLNFETPNPHIPWDQIPVKVLTESTEWPTKDRLIAGVSAFGMSGTNAHVVIEGHAGSDRKRSKPASGPHLIVLSGKNQAGLSELAERFESHLESNPDLDLADIAYNTCCRRSHLEHRAAIVVSNRDEASESLSTLAVQGANNNLLVGQGRRIPKMGWQFTGQGSQFVGMAKGLYQEFPVFQNAIDECDEVLNRTRDARLLDVLFEPGEQINHTSWTQPAIFAVQMGLSKLLNSWGIKPDVVMGHSVGQYAAACVAGIMSWSEGLQLINERGRLIGDLPPGGKMMAVFAPLEKVESAVASFPSISIAASNGTHIVVSGSEADVGEAENKFAELEIRTKLLTTSHAFHSSLMEPVLEPFQKFADGFEFKTPRIPLICNVTGEAFGKEQVLDGAYWANHIRQAVKYAESIDSVQSLGCDILLELGPQSILTRMAAANWNRPAGSLVSCLQKEMDNQQAIMKAVGRLFVQGGRPDFEALYEGKERPPILLPTYPFQRRRFWGPDKPRAAHAAFHTAHPLLGHQISLAGSDSEKRFETFLELDSPPWLPDHEVMGNVVFPGAGFIEMALAAAGEGEVAQAKFAQPLTPKGRTAIQSVVRKGEDGNQTFETFSCPNQSQNWTRNFSAYLNPADSKPPAELNVAECRDACSQEIDVERFYQRLQEIGLNYGPNFQTVESLFVSEDQTQVLSHLKVQGDVRGFKVPPTLLDGALHSLAVGLLNESEEFLFLPVGIGRVQLYQAIESDCWCLATWNHQEGKTRTADLKLFDDQGRIVLELDSLQVQQVGISTLRQMSGSSTDGQVYRMGWKKFKPTGNQTENKTWLLVGTEHDRELMAELGQKLEANQHRVIQLFKSNSESLTPVNDHEFKMCLRSGRNWEDLKAALAGKDRTPDGVTWFLQSVDLSEDSRDQFEILVGESTRDQVEGILGLVHSLSNHGFARLECGLLLATRCAKEVDDQDRVNPWQTQFWGLGRVVGAEQPELRCRLIDLPDDDSECAATLCNLMLTSTGDSQFALRHGRLHVPRLKRAELKTDQPQEFIAKSDRSYLITGGLGKLGRHAAAWLAEKGAGQVILTSRRAPNESTTEFLESISENGCEIVVHQADVGKIGDVETLFERFGADLKPLDGVIHAAGVLDDALMKDQTWDRFEKVLQPKIVGSALLDYFTRDSDLSLFLLYSSAASVLGSPGQSNYATANAFLDGLATRRNQQGAKALSINWGPWTEGMADDERILKRLSLQGIRPLNADESHRAMEKVISAGHPQCLVMDVQWRKMKMGMGGESPAMLEELMPARRSSSVGESELVSKLKKLRGNAANELLVKTVQESLQKILSTPELPETDRPLIEMGLDSLMAVEFGTELQQLLGEGVSVGPTMLFDHPTIDAISSHVLELISGGDSEQEVQPDKSETVAANATVAQRDDVAIIGMSCRFPGAHNIDEFWQNLMHGVDSVCEIPGDRWDIDRFYDPDRGPGKMYTKEGGFLSDIAEFDAEFFNISDQEACWIDPQHRMLLENSYLALEHAGIPTAPLSDSNVGVFMGIMGQDYAFLPTLDDSHVIQGFQGAGLSHSAGVGRISYVFGFEGPSVAVDTASSSSLVALHQAVRSLQDGNCNLALAGGVNAILAPVNSLLMSKAGLLAPDGRCKSFSAAADGFGRGEGCGVVVLKRLSDAQKDGDRILAVVRGGAVVHNGFSSGITAPSGKSQTRVISEALKDAGIAPSQVQYLEAHGTGTEYGDPMELGAAAGVLGKGRSKEQPLLVGSVKANISHLEAAGGISGLIKTVLAIQSGTIPPQAHFDQPSPHVPWQRMPVKMVTEVTNWPETEERIAGVTALGLVGTNAHVVLSSAPQHEATAAEQEDIVNHTRPAQLLVMSARNSEALDQLKGRYFDFLQSHPDVTLTDFCFTAANGRRHYEHRVAITCGQTRELQKQMAQLSDRQPVPTNGNGKSNGSMQAASDDVFQAKAQRNPKLAWVFGDGTELSAAAQIRAAKELFDTDPVFRELMHQFDNRLSEEWETNLGFRLVDWPDQSEGGDEALSDVHRFAIQAGMSKILSGFGVEPDVVTGWGVGQYTAACVSGVLCFLDAIQLIAMQTKLLQANPSESSQNGAEVDSQDALDQFEKFADQFNYYPPNLPLICGTTGESIPIHRSLGGSYWREHCTNQASVEETVKTLAESKCDLHLEIANGSSSALLSTNLKVAAASILSEDESVTKNLFRLLGQLYVSGFNPDFSKLAGFRQSSRIAIPHYPFQKKRYWITEIADHMGSSDLTAKSSNSNSKQLSQQ